MDGFSIWFAEVSRDRETGTRAVGRASDVTRSRLPTPIRMVVMAIARLSPATDSIKNQCVTESKPFETVAELFQLPGGVVSVLTS
jgi:hypothetical protein